MNSSDTKFHIAGAGLAGSLMAIYLGRAGYRVDVYERRGDLRDLESGPGRSINLALSVRGIHALERAGLADKVLADAVAMPGRMVHGFDGSSAFQPYSKNPDEHINSVSRLELNRTLIDEAEKTPGVRLFFDHKCQEVDLATGAMEILKTTTLETTRVEDGIVIGADGAFSVVRRRLQRTDRFNYQQSYLEHGYKELVIPPDDNGGHRIEKNALHIWPRRSYMMIALPNQDGSFTCTLFWPLEGPFCFDNLQTPDDILNFFQEHFADAVPHMPTLVEDYQGNPVSTLMTVRCNPWYHKDKCVLIGDAAHAVVPFYGQGINAGFEDCEALIDCMTKHSTDFEQAFADYNVQRKENSDTIADLAIANFVEMRDRVGSTAFLRKKRRERLLDRWFPNYVPLYSLVTFSRVPYAEAVRQSVRQDKKVSIVAGVLIALATIVLGLLILWQV